MLEKEILKVLQKWKPHVKSLQLCSLPQFFKGKLKANKFFDNVDLSGEVQEKSNVIRPNIFLASLEAYTALIS